MGNRGGCVTGPYTTPTTLGHTTKTESKHLYIIHRSKHREAAKTRRQKYMDQMKGQIKTPEKELNEIEISDLSDAEVKTLVIKIIKELSEDLSSIKKGQSEMEGTLSEIKNNLQGNNNRVDKARIKSMIGNHKEAKKNQ